MPPHTALTVHARSSDGALLDDPAWLAAPFTLDFDTSPIDLQQTLVPNLTPQSSADAVHDSYVIVEFKFTSTVPDASPKLKSFDIAYKCYQGGPA